MAEKAESLKYQPRLPLDKIRREQYQYHSYHEKKGYTWWKARYYMECASFLVYKCQHLNPNTLTILYGIFGVAVGILLNIKPFLALIIMFNKGILDWADGHIARIQNRQSVFGEMLDNMAGKIGTVSFYVGLSFYLGHNTTMYIVPYLIITFFLLSRLGLKLSRAWVTDLILFVVGVHILVS